MSSPSSESELARKCALGNIQAREQLYNLYAARLYSLCLRYCSDSSHARDLMHDTIIKAYSRIWRFRGRNEGSLYSWLARIAVNLCMDDIRKKKKLPIISETDTLTEEPIYEPPEDGLARIPLEKIDEFIRQLPGARRMIFNLHCVDGIPHTEIGQILGITADASRSALAKAKKALAEQIRDYLNSNE